MCWQMVKLLHMTLSLYCITFGALSIQVIANLQMWIINFQPTHKSCCLLYLMAFSCINSNVSFWNMRVCVGLYKSSTVFATQFIDSHLYMNIFVTDWASHSMLLNDIRSIAAFSFFFVVVDILSNFTASVYI